MKYSIFRTSSFKKAYKKLHASDQELVLSIVAKLANDEVAITENLDTKDRNTWTLW